MVWCLFPSAPFPPRGGTLLSTIEWNKQSTAASETRTRAEQGDITAEFGLAHMYQKGRGVPQDYNEAVRWYRKGAEQGYAKAQFNLGDMYRDGEGVPQDYAEAVRWVHKAADQGDPKAESALGYAYYSGEGVPQEYAEAVGWYRKAADQGYASAKQVSPLSIPTVWPCRRMTSGLSPCIARRLNRATLSLSRVSVTCIPLDEACRRTTERLSAGGTKLPTRVTQEPSVPWNYLGSDQDHRRKFATSSFLRHR